MRMEMDSEYSCDREMLFRNERYSPIRYREDDPRRHLEGHNQRQRSRSTERYYDDDELRLNRRRRSWDWHDPSDYSEPIRGEGRDSCRGRGRSRGRGRGRDGGRGSGRGRDGGQDRGRGRGFSRGRGRGRGHSPSNRPSYNDFQQGPKDRYKPNYNDQRRSRSYKPKGEFSENSDRDIRHWSKYRSSQDVDTRFNSDYKEGSWTHDTGRTTSPPNAQLGFALVDSLIKPLPSGAVSTEEPSNLKGIETADELAMNTLKDSKEDELTKEIDAITPLSSNAGCSSGKGDMSYKSASKNHTSPCYVTLKKDKKPICRTQCTNPPIQLLSGWDLRIVKKKTLKGLDDLPTFILTPAFEDRRQKYEWNTFFPFLYNYDKVGAFELDGQKMYVMPSHPPPKKGLNVEDLCFPHAVVAYDLKKYESKEACDTSVVERHASADPCLRTALAFKLDACAKASSSCEKGTCSSISKCHEAVNSAIPFVAKDAVSTERSLVRTDPSYLKTLGQAHSGWIFGAVAELVDNARDANASRLDISVEYIFDKIAGSEIPVLSIIDDGNGMNHEDILRMVSFGHKPPDEDNVNHIGRFGVGFKTGSMRLGRDALVLTQTTQSRSIAFLSQSLNEGKDNLEVPIVSYRRKGLYMEFDASAQSEALATYNLESIKDFSPFNEYLIGEKAGLFQSSTGTQIYIWNLDKWGSDYSLEWLAGIPGGSSFHHGDILVRSRRVRTRPGQTSRKVHLDYSLRAYLEVIFAEPRMKIYVQRALVKSLPLSKSLNNTAVIDGEIMGKPVRVILGRSQLEWDEGNCGMFLYWHGRLIEAYKRVGSMIHSADMGRGVIGVIDVTKLMDDGNGGVWVHSNKQGFQDCEAYALLEEWLGNKTDEYWDTFFDPVQLKKITQRYKPDNEWVQCEKCRKWRMLHPDFDSRNLPKDWFCYMEPFSGKCEMPEQKPGRGIITVGLKRSGYNLGMVSKDKESILADKDNAVSGGKGIGYDDVSNQGVVDDEQRPVFKRLRKGPSRICAKK